MGKWPTPSSAPDGDPTVQSLPRRYTILNVLGEGASAKVCKCEKDGEIFAMKIVKKFKIN